MTGRELAYQVLMEFDTSHDRISTILDRKLNKSTLSDRDKKFLYNLVYGVLRQRGLIDWRAGMFYKGNYDKVVNKLKNILRLALYEIDFLDFIPPHATVNEYVSLIKKKLPRHYTGLLNGILRNYLREGKYLKPEKKFKYPETQIAVTYSLPEWLTRRWIAAWGAEETEKIAAGFVERPVFDVRFSHERMAENEFLEVLHDNGIFFQKSAYFDDVFKIYDIQTLTRLGLFANGVCRVQDESGRLAVDLLDPQNDDTILDVCAAPGGKFASIRQNVSNGAVLLGLELFYDRLQVLKNNCRSWQIDPCHLVQGDGLSMPFKSGVFTKILLDVPCSGLGTLQKHPDIKWRRTESDVAELARLQLGLLESAAELLVAGGSIVYSTCTIDPQENEEVIGQFMANQGARFTPVMKNSKKFAPFLSGEAIRTFPHKHSMDGSFAVCLQKVS